MRFRKLFGAFLSSFLIDPLRFRNAALRITDIHTMLGRNYGRPGWQGVKNQHPDTASYRRLYRGESHTIIGLSHVEQKTAPNYFYNNFVKPIGAEAIY